MIADRLRTGLVLEQTPREKYKRMKELTKHELNDIANRYRADILEYASELKMCNKDKEPERHAFISNKIEELQAKYQIVRGKKVVLP
jgi:hypothetical protein